MAHGVDCARTWNKGSKGGGIPADVSSDGAGLGEVCLVVHHDVVCGERGRLAEICVDWRAVGSKRDLCRDPLDQGGVR